MVEETSPAEVGACSDALEALIVESDRLRMRIAELQQVAIDLADEGRRDVERIENASRAALQAQREKTEELGVKYKDLKTRFLDLKVRCRTLDDRVKELAADRSRLKESLARAKAALRAGGRSASSAGRDDGARRDPPAEPTSE